ncbi:hypothetical protein ABZ319_31660 [Nocardia sp. NPDC005978]|uniref:hypothetical protein n=1 Tax=Nocardia sp. NPDC005978 TaxID=3156725 RepID=UPI0033A31B1C
MGFLGGVFGSRRKRLGRQAFEMVRDNPAVSVAEYDAANFSIRLPGSARKPVRGPSFSSPPTPVC